MIKELNWLYEMIKELNWLYEMIKAIMKWLKN